MSRQLIPVILIILFMAPEIGAYTNQRHEWWKIRLRNLREESASLEKNALIGPAVRELVKNDIERAGAVIRAFERERGGDPLHHQGKTWSDDEIRTFAGRITAPVFSACLLEYITTSAGHRDNYRAVKGAAENEIRRMMKTSLGAADDELLDAVVTRDVSKVEWQYCTLEAFLSAAMRTSGDLRARVIASAGESVAPDKSALSPAEVRRLVVEKTMAECSALMNPSIIAIMPDDLASSPSWRSVRSRIDHRLSLMKDLKEMADTGGEFIAPVKLRELLDNPADTERLVFSRAAVRYFDRRNIDTAAGGEPSGNGTFIRIPKNPDGTMLFRDLDEARHAAVISIRGGEAPAFFTAAEKNFASIVDRYTAETRTGFSVGEERLRRIKDDDPDGGVANEKEFLQSKAVFVDRMALVQGYVLRSTRYLKWLPAGRGLDGGAIVASIKARAAANRAYLSFAEMLAVEGEAVAPLRQPVLQRRYALAARNIESLYRAAGNSMSLDKNAVRFLSAAQQGDVRAVRSSFNDNLKAARTASGARLTAFSKSVAAAAKKEQGLSEAFQCATADFEIEQMMKRLDEYSALYARLDYTGGALGRYAKLYNDMESRLSRGEKPGRLDEVIAQKSLLGMVEHFDTGAIRAERATAGYLRREIATEISRLATLINYYRQRRIEIHAGPSLERFAERRKALDESPSIAIASWTMNGLNVEEVDRKAAHRLTGMYHRLIWQAKRPPETGVAGTPPSASSDGHLLSPLIPAGWFESEPAADEAGDGIIKRYTSADKSASITIARVQAGGRMLNEISARWAKERGAGIVRQRWGKKENLDYFWTLARSPGRNVMEVYVLGEGQGALVVSGTTPRDRYTAFKAHLDAVFESMAR
ncbi:MAG: hypothetical protein MUC76_03935 [Spirochaetes bacterium]|nr:hypothetical protein [Spirochaetota bacterium]